MGQYNVSKWNPCITLEDMQPFLAMMTGIADGYTVVELNEHLETQGGTLKISIGEVRTRLEQRLGAKNITITPRSNGKYNIGFFIGEIRNGKAGKGKDGYIRNISYK